MRRPPHDSTEAGQQAAQSLEDEAVHRAMEGVRRPVLNRGKQVYIHAFRQARMAGSLTLKLRTKRLSKTTSEYAVIYSLYGQTPTLRTTLVGCGMSIGPKAQASPICQITYSPVSN
jgi:hypothetical protein